MRHHTISSIAASAIAAGALALGSTPLSAQGSSVVQTDTQAGPSGVSSVFSRASSALSGTSCRQAAGHRPGASEPASAASPMAMDQ